MNKKFLVLTLTVLMSLFSVSVFAQSTTSGALTGTVTDDTGAALPGVTVELSGPAMQGTRSDITDGGGKFRFVNVPPGDKYQVSANLSGFQVATKTGFRVSLGQEATVNLGLRAALTEAITVTADAPLVDVTNTTTGTNITSDQFETLPTQRSFQALTQMAPGVSMGMSDSRAQLANSPTVGASSAPENNYIIDGLSTTDPRYGTSGANVTMNFVEEVQVMTGGYPAEYGRSTGGVFNVITKSGGNEFHGDVFGYYSPAEWTSERVTTREKGTGTFNNVTDNQDFGFDLGGPIMRDRLWFFAALDPTKQNVYRGALVDEESGHLTDLPGREYERDELRYAGKLTFAATPNHNLVFSTFGNPTETNGWLGAVTSEPGGALRSTESGSNNMNLRYTGIFGTRWMVEGNVGRYQSDSTLAPASDIGRNVPRQIDESANAAVFGYEYGGFQRYQQDEANRDSYNVKMSNFFGSHELRYGLDIENNEYVADLTETWYRYFGPTTTSLLRGDCSRSLPTRISCDQLQERIYDVKGAGETANEAAFLQDQWKVLPNLTLNLGVRYERQKMSSARGVAIAENAAQAAHEEDPIHADEFVLDNNWAPRLGITWDPMNNGRSKIYGFAGRFFEAVPLDINIRALNGEDYIITDYQHSSFTGSGAQGWVNPGGFPVPDAVRQGAIGAVTQNGWTKYRVRNLVAATATALAADLKTQYQDEYIIGGEYQFGAAWSAGVRLVDRELKRVIEDFGVFSDPTDPTALTGYAIGNPGEGVLGGPYPIPKRFYRAAELTLQRARQNNWNLTSSFTYSQAEGNYEGLYMTGYEQLDPNITALYDIPSFGPNSYGPISADRPYQFKVYSAYTFPFGLTVSEGFIYSAGQPYSERGPEIVNGYGNGTIHLTPRGGAGRTPDYFNLDLHADWELPFFRTADRGLSFIVDVFNVTDQSETLEVDQDYVYQGMEGFEDWEEAGNLDDFGNPKYNASLAASPYFGTPILYQAPRRVQVGVKFAF